MLLQNEDKFKYCNIPYWWSKGYTGKGVKIGILADDFNASMPVFEGKAYAVPYLNRGESGHLHGFQVAHVIHQVAPDAELYPLSVSYPTKPDYKDSLNWAYDNGIRLINMSNGGFSENPYMAEAEKEAVKKGMTLVCSGGNYGDGENTLGCSAQTDFWLSVGACVLENGEIKRVNYSSVGKELDICGFTNLAVGTNSENPLIFDGTSCASPFVVGMLALWFQRFYKLNNRYPVQDETHKFLISNCEDLQNKGFDNYTGYGLFKLPNKIVDEIVLQIGNKKIINCGVEQIMDVVPFIKENRTFVPIRFVAEALGYSVFYDNKTKTVTIIK